MKTLKLSIVLCGVALLSLLSVLVFVPNPEEAAYYKMVQEVMQSEALANETEVLERHPEIAAMKEELLSIRNQENQLSNQQRNPLQSFGYETEQAIILEKQQLRQQKEVFKDEMRQFDKQQAIIPALLKEQSVISKKPFSEFSKVMMKIIRAFW